MQINQFLLSSGLHVIVVRKVLSPLVTFKLFVKVGSRHDQALSGLSHLAEHLIFGNSSTAPLADINGQIDRLGGTINATTTKEFTEYSLVILKENFFAGVQLFSETFNDPTFNLDNLEQEKEIIYEEILNSYGKANTIWDIFAQAIWKESPLRTPICGYKDSLQEITLADIVEFHQKYYCGGNIVIVVVGDIEVTAIHDTFQKMFGGIKNGLPPQKQNQPAIHTLNRPKDSHLEKNSLQTHLLVGYPGVGINAPPLNTFKLVNKILGNGVSSRLYQKLRHDLHLVYSISSVLAIYEDTGYFSVWTNFNHSKKESVLNAITEEFASLKKIKIQAIELETAKIRYKRDLLLNCETDSSLSDFLGTSLMLTGKIKSFEDIIVEINSVSIDQVYELANSYFCEANRFVVSIGKNMEN